MTITKEMVRAGLENGAIDGDGHSIVAPEYFIERGFDSKDIQKLEMTHQSGSGKHQIYEHGDMFTGSPVTELKRVYCLDFHYWVASQVGIEYPQAYGRGTQARHIVASLRKWIENDG